jgi:hypothetical protein
MSLYLFVVLLYAGILFYVANQSLMKLLMSQELGIGVMLLGYHVPLIWSEHQDPIFGPSGTFEKSLRARATEEVLDIFRMMTCL